MTFRAASALFLLLALLSPASASALPPGSLTAPRDVELARQDPKYTFCSAPKLPLSPRQRALCPLASQVDGCEALVAACKSDASSAEEAERRRRNAERESGTWRQLVGALGFLAQGLVWLLIALVIAAIAFPLVRALLRARRDKALADAPVRPNVAAPVDRPPPPRAEADLRCRGGATRGRRPCAPRRPRACAQPVPRRFARGARPARRDPARASPHERRVRPVLRGGRCAPAPPRDRARGRPRRVRQRRADRRRRGERRVARHGRRALGCAARGGVRHDGGPSGLPRARALGCGGRTEAPP